MSRGWILLFFLSLEAQIILEKSDRIEKCMFKQSVYFIVSEHLNLYVYCIEFIIGYSWVKKENVMLNVERSEI